MHHSLPFYGRYQNRFLKAYMTLAPFTRLPLLGKLVRRLANNYARSQHGGFALNSGEAAAIVDASDWVAIGECACRKVFHNCDNPIEAEIVVGFGREVYSDAEHNFREVSKDEAKALLLRCKDANLMSIMMQCRGHYYAICNCCHCCCVPYRLKRRYGIEYAIIRDENIVESFKHQMSEHQD
ncbi:ferredoxin-like protein [Dehalogenimonas sp. THU2]|uniref:ferredoxin-like protein n=1 Tax=Dehalogenimonas sp. THU2 TaxID=3151121 RepID=UPI0032188420